ncbi:MAG: T9SS type A sorting domain-containing protein, partial [Bacteroidota bacterium]
KRLAILLIVPFSFTLNCSAQLVYTKIYQHDLIGNDVQFDGFNLIIAGSNQTRFGFMKTDTAGTIINALQYKYHDAEALRFIRLHPNGGYVMGGISKAPGASVEETEIVLIRTNANGVPQWAKSYRFNNNLGGILTGMEIQGNGDIVITGYMYVPGNTLFAGLVANLDTAGVIDWQHLVPIQSSSATGLARPVRGNLAIANNGTIISGWNKQETGIGSAGKLIELHAYTAAGLFLWDKEYDADAILNLGLTPGDNGIAAYIEQDGGDKGLAKFDANGDFEWGRLDAFQSPAEIARVKPRLFNIPFLHDNRTTVWVNNSSLIPPSVDITTNRYGLRDFTMIGRTAYMYGNTFNVNSSAVIPVLTKSIISDTAANCLVAYDPTNNYALMTVNVDSAQLGPLPLTTLVSQPIQLQVAMLDQRVRTICVGEGLVWPGDVNSDGVANVRDIPFLAKAWGETGPPRTTQSIAWQGWPALDWSNQFFNGANYKHADCNGNGHVGFVDLLAILANYGQTHNKGGNGTEDDPPLFLQFSQDSVGVGQMVEVDVMLGNTDLPVDSIYGLAFSISYNPTLIDSGSLVFTPVNSWLGTDSVDLVHLEKDLPGDGMFEIGMSRTDQAEVSGYGMLGKVSFITVDNIAGKNDLIAEDLRLDIQPLTAIKFSEDELVLHGCPDSIVVTQLELATSIEPEVLLEGLSIFPNPSKGQFHLDVSTHFLQRLHISDLSGRMVFQAEINASEYDLELSHLPKGVYLLKGESAQGVWTEKLVIQ